MDGAAAPNYVSPKRISLQAYQTKKTYPYMNEKWIQDLIWADPKILGLGDLEPFRKEAQEPTGGRVDLILSNNDRDEFYEVEVQLGPTDPSHIIRTIEYWDVERTRYPDRAHSAVLIAEDITSRFLNVISLLNKHVPIIAIQMQAVEVGNYLTLVFTTVVDLSLRRDDEDDSPQELVQRDHWEKKPNSKAGLEIVDTLADFVQKQDATLALKYNLGFVQVNKRGRIFLYFVPQKARTKLGIKMSRTAACDDLENKIQAAGLEVHYDERRGYLFSIENGKFGDCVDAIKGLVALGVKQWAD
jgi:hypothetical protein